MADDLQTRFNQIGPRIKDLEATIAQAHEQLRGIKELLAGGNPVGDARDYFAGGWARKYGAGYTWSYAKDSQQIKRLLRQMGIEDLKARMIAYLSNDEPFLVRQQHPFGIFVTTINSYTVSGRREGAPPASCQHNPPCLTDVEHTRKRGHDNRQPRQ